MTGYEAGEGPDLCEQAHLVHLGHHGVQHLPLKRPEHNGLVLDRVEYEALPRLDEAGPDMVDAGDCNNKAVLSSASPFHLEICTNYPDTLCA